MLSRSALGPGVVVVLGLFLRPEDPARLITAERIERHVRTLSADELAGRRTGEAGALEAARYLAGELEAAGLAPAGDEGGFLQAVPLRWLEYESVPRLTLVAQDGEEVEAVYGVDFEGFTGLPSGAELRVLVVRSPEDLPPEPDAGVALVLDASSSERREWLGESRGWGLVVAPGSKRPGSRARERPPHGRRWMGDEPPPQAALSIRGLLREGLLAGDFPALRASVDGGLVEPPAVNVVGLLRGVGELAEQAVVITAHYDHIGTRAPSEGGGPDEDLVYNGADDDASGCAAVLELARALAAGPAPKRTLVFLLVTGEEMGLLGAEFHLDHPAVPLERTVCNLNFEMIGRPDELAGGPGRLWLTGYERSNLGEAFAGLGTGVVPDPRPDQNFFRRSDNYAFAVRGIVAQTLSSYDLHSDYHDVGDEADKLDYAHMEACVRAALLFVRALADGLVAPEWEPGGDPSRGD